MIGRRLPPRGAGDAVPLGFDDYDLRLGDIMRGERATLGKSLLDVQRELKIKAAYIAAIENADVGAFETPGFIAGYVRSYARYLGLDPEWAYDCFCREANLASPSGQPRDGATAAAGPVYRQPGKPADPFSAREKERDPIAHPRVSFAPPNQSPFASVEPRAIGSTLVLLALIGAIGYGGWSVLQEIQRVQVSPVDRAPDAVAEVDPLDGARVAEGALPGDSGVAPGTPDALDRLYRPRPLDVPVMVPRDGPIAAIDPADEPIALAGPAQPGGPALPGSAGARGGPAVAAGPETAPQDDAEARAILADLGAAEPGAPPRVTEDVPEVVLVAVRDAWVRVRAADGSVLLEKILRPGDTWTVPATEGAPTLRTGAAGAVFFAVNGETYGPAGARGAVVDGIALASAELTDSFAPADVDGNPEAREAVRVAEAALRPAEEPIAAPAE